jgi:phenylacetic acid degradation protein
MAVYRYKGVAPVIGDACYIAESAVVLGDVVLGNGCYVGPGAVLRGDYGSLRLGAMTAVEENVVIHARPGEVCTIGSMVTLGHGAIVHNVALIDDGAVIGMGATVSDWARVGSWAAVGEAALVKSRQEIPARGIAVGVPAKVIGETTDEWVATWRGFKMKYVALAATYPKDLERIS